MMNILNKIDNFLKEATNTVLGGGPKHAGKWEGVKPIQFIQWYGDFRPGDRMEMDFTPDGILIVGQNAEGNFAGYNHEYFISDPAEMEVFKSLEGKVWNFV